MPLGENCAKFRNSFEPCTIFPGRLVTVELFVEFQLLNFFRLAGRARTSFYKKANFLDEKLDLDNRII